MAGLKSIEIGFRRFLLRVLGLLIKRDRPLPHDLDFGTKKYLFVRQDRIGDVLVSTPLIHALKQQYPSAVVDFLLSSNNHFVLENEPLVRKRWVYRKNLSSGIEVLRAIRRERYDFVIDLMDNPSATSTVFCLMAGGQWNVGLSKANAYAYDIVVPLLSRKDTHIVDRLAELLTVFEIPPRSTELKIWYRVKEESHSAALQFLSDQSLKPKEVLGLNISPGRGTRFWGVENYQKLLRWLCDTYPALPILVLSQPADREVAESIVRPFAQVCLSGVTETFDQFAALVEQLRILITPDTSAVHLAAAFSIPAVVLYVQSDKSLRIWEPYGSVSETLVTDVDDLKTISADEVIRAVSKLLGPNAASEAVPRELRP